MRDCSVTGCGRTVVGPDLKYYCHDHNHYHHHITLAIIIAVIVIVMITIDYLVLETWGESELPPLDFTPRGESAILAESQKTLK